MMEIYIGLLRKEMINFFSMYPFTNCPLKKISILKYNKFNTN